MDFDNLKSLGEPFYIGKGNRNRDRRHLRLCIQSGPSYAYRHYKRLREMLATGNKPVIIRLKDGLTDAGACELEMQWIKAIGRIDLGTGPLCNHTDGGEGLVQPSKATRRKISWHKRRDWANPKTRARLLTALNDPQVKAAQHPVLLQNRPRGGRPSAGPQLPTRFLPVQTNMATRRQTPSLQLVDLRDLIYSCCLTKTERILIQLRDIEGMDCTEIAPLLHVSKNTVYRMLRVIEERFNRKNRP